MYQNYLLVVLLFGCIATQSNAQSDAKPERIDWLALTHDSNLSKKKLLADSRVAIQEKIPISDLKEGTVYLYCMESGALLDAVPIKDAYWVMIFPDPKATKFNFWKSRITWRQIWHDRLMGLRQSKAMIW